MDIDNLKFVDKVSDITTPYYMKLRAKGVEEYSDIYRQTEDSFVELPDCNSIDMAHLIANEVLDRLLDTVHDVGNEIVAYMVARRR